jgi:hypothetical protein
MTTSADIFIDYPGELFGYMRRTRKPVFHNSNVFLRDVQYAIQDYFEDRDGTIIRADQAEVLAREVARAFESKGIFRRVNPQGYLLNFPDLLTGKDGTKGPLSGMTEASEMPPPAAAAPAKAEAKPAPAPPKPAAAAPASAPPTGAAPAGAKATPPWLKK